MGLSARIRSIGEIPKQTQTAVVISGIAITIALIAIAIAIGAIRNAN